MKNSITVAEWHALPDRKSLWMLDVRTAPEYAHDHLPEAHWLPLDKLEKGAELPVSPGNTPLYIMCQSGKRAARAAEYLASRGYSHCIVIEGGMNAWMEAGFPFSKTENAPRLSLIRQVQVIIGLVVAAGSLLAVLVDPRWVWIPFFAGCGLTFAGLSGYCGLAMLLAKMPWNSGAASCELNSKK